MITDEEFNILIESFVETVTAKTKGDEFDPFIESKLDEGGVQYAEDLLEYCKHKMKTIECPLGRSLYWSTSMTAEGWLVRKGIYERIWNINESKVIISKK